MLLLIAMFSFIVVFGSENRVGNEKTRESLIKIGEQKEIANRTIHILEECAKKHVHKAINSNSLNKLDKEAEELVNAWCPLQKNKKTNNWLKPAVAITAVIGVGALILYKYLGSSKKD